MGSSLSKNSDGKKSTRARKQSREPGPWASPVVNSAIIQNGLPQPSTDPKARDDSSVFPFDGLDLSSLSDQQLAQMFFTAPKLHEYGGVTIVRLSKSLVAKGGEGVSPSESQNMVFASESLHLPVPQVYRAFTASIPEILSGQPIEGHFIVMSYISGPTVEECWDSLNSSQRQSVTAQVATIINNMQSLPLQLPPGPIGRIREEKFEGPWFTENGAGPFSTLQDLETWCNHKIDVCIQLKQASLFTRRFRFRSVVLTHQDIAPRNLILDSQGKVWIIDWGIAGVYPPGFEQAAFQQQSRLNGEFTEMVLEGIIDRQEHVMKQFATIGYSLSVGANL